MTDVPNDAPYVDENVNRAQQKALFIPRPRATSNNPKDPFVVDLNISKPSARIVARNPAWNVTTVQHFPKIQSPPRPSHLSALLDSNTGPYGLSTLAERRADKATNIEVNRIQKQAALHRRELALQAKREKRAMAKDAIVSKGISSGEDDIMVGTKGDGMASLKTRMDIIQREILSKKKRVISLIYVDLRDLLPHANLETECIDDPGLSTMEPFTSPPYQSHGVKRKRFIARIQKIECSSSSSSCMDDSSGSDIDKNDVVYSLSSDESDDGDSICQDSMEEDEPYIEKPLASPKSKKRPSSPKPKKDLLREINKIFDGCNLVSTTSSTAGNVRDGERRRQLVMDFFQGKKSGHLWTF